MKTSIYRLLPMLALLLIVTQPAHVRRADQTRRIDLPADWIVSVSPAQISLAPGEQTTVTVTVAPGSLVPQGIIPRAESNTTKPALACAKRAVVHKHGSASHRWLAHTRFVDE